MNILRAIEVKPDPTCFVVRDQDGIRESYAGYLTDESKFRGDVPLSLSFPTSLEQLVAVIKDHYALNEASTISGTRSGIVGASVPVGKTHSISLEKLVGIEELGFDEKENCWFLRAKAGTTLSTIQNYLKEHKADLLYPVDPTYQHAAIGGNTGTNASGMRTFYYGSTREWIRALTVVLSDGSVIKLKRGEVKALEGKLSLNLPNEVRSFSGQTINVPLTKHSIGYHFSQDVDPIDIFIGSEGTLGVFAEVEIKLTSKPKHRLYFVQFFNDDAQAFEFGALAQQLDLKILALEFFDRPSITIASTHSAKATSKMLQMLKPEFDGGIFLDLMFDSPEELELAADKIASLVKQVGGNPDESTAGIDDRDLEDFKVFRHAIPEMINATVAKRKQTIPRLHKISTDMAVNPKYLKELYTFYKKTFREIGIDWFIFGHFGNGHLHVNVVPKTEDELDAFLETYPSIGEKIVKLGGAVAGEHGIGRLKKQFMAIQYSPSEIETMKELKSFFDPRWLLGRGVLFD